MKKRKPQRASLQAITIAMMDSRFVRMWPRSILKDFVPLKRRKTPYPNYLKQLTLLDRPGVYVLYDRDESVYYIGRTSTSLGERLLTHHKQNSRYARFEYFSVFLIDDANNRRDVERILISAIPSARNSSRPMKAHKLYVRAYSN